MLQQAATIFETEFFRKIKDYSIERKDIEEILETLFTLNIGKFYQLSNENYKTLVLEIIKRKPLKIAAQYAKYFPDEEICKSTINRFENLKNEEANLNATLSKTKTMNWPEIYNRLFELINNQGDVATYFSGPRFINTIKEFEPYFPNYNQFIEQRNIEGKSTSRKIFYYDILMSLNEPIRLKVINRILEILKPFQLAKSEEIEELLGKKFSQDEPIPVLDIRKDAPRNPIVFISYSWDDEHHKEWVLNLANRLSSDGIDTILDRYYLRPGKNLPYFVENSIKKAERIIIIFTPNYKLKADNRTGGVGYEYSIMNVNLYNDQIGNEKIIPILRTGNKEESIPTFMQQLIHIDIRNNSNFEVSYSDLLREIYNEPAIQKPKLGDKPTF